MVRLFLTIVVIAAFIMITGCISTNQDPVTKTVVPTTIPTITLKTTDTIKPITTPITKVPIRTTLSESSYSKKEFPEAFTWTDKGNNLYDQGKIQEALDAYNKAIEIDPTFALAWFSKGTLLGKQGKYDEAVACFDKAVLYDPTHFESWNNKGIVLYYQGKYKDAVACFDKALEINPGYSQAKANRQNALQRM
jgi:tetratricopeptide (TPR) repeat protein